MRKLSPEQIESLLNDVGELPTLPSIATTIMEKTLEANVNAKQIADMVEKDQALALKVLKVANSPFYRRIKEISTIRGAVVLLGFNVLKSIVLSISVINLFSDKDKRALDFYKFWQHSIACAVCAKAIAGKILPESTEDAFIAGLLHDLGKVIADQLICRDGEYAQVLQISEKAGSDIIEVEHDLVGIDHASLGKYLMERWNLPSHLCKSVGYHHSLVDITDDQATKKLCAIVHVADMVTNHLGLGLNEIPTGFVDPELLNHLDLTSHDIQEISLSLKDSISDISDEMGIPKAEPKTYFEVLQSANAQLGRLSLDLEQKKMALERRTAELSSLNHMNSELQASLKLSEITKIITSNTLTILEAKKTRCIIRLNNLRVLITESFLVSDSVNTRAGLASVTKELLDRTNGIYPKSHNSIFAPLKVNNRIIGVIEALLNDNNGPEEINQKALMLRTIGEVGAQAIQRAMLVTKNIKSQRLAAVSKTAIAANHEINSPLTTILLKLDMLTNESSLDTHTKNILGEVKSEALKIRNVVKKMLEISDVVETNYTSSEKMLDLNKASDHPTHASSPEPHTKNNGGHVDASGVFEEYLVENPSSGSQKQSMPSGGIKTDSVAGFEDYLENIPSKSPQKKGSLSSADAPGDTPGFEDYFEEKAKTGSQHPAVPTAQVSVNDIPGFEDYLEE
ncbi:MAG: HDOD domain-containing protein [Desulfomonilia bacterium]